MSKEDLIGTEEILFTDKRLFKDNEEHAYNCTCYDGIAFCERVDYEDDEEGANKHAPKRLLLGYPTMAEVRGTAKETACRDYLGLDKRDTLTYAHIAIKYGRLGRNGLTPDHLNVIDKLARDAKMDWLVTSTKGNFKDGETGKPMSAKKALKQMCEGLTFENFMRLSYTDLVVFIDTLASQL